MVVVVVGASVVVVVVGASVVVVVVGASVVVVVVGASVVVVVVGASVVVVVGATVVVVVGVSVVVVGPRVVVVGTRVVVVGPAVVDVGCPFTCSCRSADVLESATGAKATTANRIVTIPAASPGQLVLRSLLMSSPFLPRSSFNKKGPVALFHSPWPP